MKLKQIKTKAVEFKRVRDIAIAPRLGEAGTLILALVAVAEAARVESVALLAVAGEIEDASDRDTAWEQVRQGATSLAVALAKLEAL